MRKCWIKVFVSKIKISFFFQRQHKFLFFFLLSKVGLFVSRFYLSNNIFDIEIKNWQSLQNFKLSSMKPTEEKSKCVTCLSILFWTWLWMNEELNGWRAHVQNQIFFYSVFSSVFNQLFLFNSSHVLVLYSFCWPTKNHF